MTLQELFNLLGENPIWILFYFLAIPVTAVLLGVFSKEDSDQSPWKYFYCTLIYLSCVPGIFSFTLSVYFFLFEKRSILATDVYTQILPLLSMLASLLIIRQNADLDKIPGFDKINGLVMIIGALLTGMWILDRTHIIAISFMPFYFVVLILIGLLVLIRYSVKKLFARN
jgi:hypothetical protein